MSVSNIVDISDDKEILFLQNLSLVQLVYFNLAYTCFVMYILYVCVSLDFFSIKDCGTVSVFVFYLFFYVVQLVEKSKSITTNKKTVSQSK